MNTSWVSRTCALAKGTRHLTTTEPRTNTRLCVFDERQNVHRFFRLVFGSFFGTL